MVILYSTPLTSVKHLIERVLELQDDETQSPTVPEVEEVPDLENLLKSLQPKIGSLVAAGVDQSRLPD